MWGAIIAGVGALIGGSQAKSAAGDVERTSIVNSKLVIDETQEELRRLNKDIAQTEGMAAAQSAASGVQTSGSRQLSIEGVKKENKAQLSWLLKSGAQKAAVVRLGGQLQSSQLKSQAQAQNIKGFGQIAQGLYSAYGSSTSNASSGK